MSDNSEQNDKLNVFGMQNRFEGLIGEPPQDILRCPHRLPVMDETVFALTHTNREPWHKPPKEKNMPLNVVTAQQIRESEKLMKQYNYQSPVEIIRKPLDDINMQICKIEEDTMFKVIARTLSEDDIVVDKAELIRALNYDRAQYEKGYADGQADCPDWISVEDRLPTKSTGNLFCAIEGGYGIYLDILSYYKDLHRFSECDFPDEKGKGGFIYYDSGEQKYVKVDGVKFWMPCPEFPWEAGDK